jgi:glycosyltransferase involved in cell wall biosynthesis
MALNFAANGQGPSIAVLIPCYNEELTIREVVRGFREQLPHANICVFDNNSTDRTVAQAKAAGAIIASERRQGKGYVVQSMFGRIDADVYVMVDGDGTYPAADVHNLLAPVLADDADMVLGSTNFSRLETNTQVGGDDGFVQLSPSENNKTAAGSL